MIWKLFIISRARNRTWTLTSLTWGGAQGAGVAEARARDKTDVIHRGELISMSGDNELINLN